MDTTKSSEVRTDTVMTVPKMEEGDGDDEEHERRRVFSLLLAFLRG